MARLGAQHLSTKLGRSFVVENRPGAGGALATGLVSGAVLAFARALGEFGATLTFAGSREGVTRTLPLEIYALISSATSPTLFAIGTVTLGSSGSYTFSVKFGTAGDLGIEAHHGEDGP